MGVFSVLLQVIFVAIASLIALHFSGKSVFILRKAQEILHGKPGCAPLPDIGNVTLHYFKGRGRAEAIRMLLEETGTPYEQNLYTKDNWADNKKLGIQSGLFTFGQVPAIETTSGSHLVQSHAILHYIGRSTGLQCDCEDLHHCEVTAMGAEDARSKLAKIVHDPKYTLADREDYLKNIMPVWLGHFERIAPALTKQDKAFFHSNRLTWVDFLVFDLLEFNREFARYDFGPKVTPLKDILADYPKLNNFFQYFAGRPAMVKYRSSKKRLPFKLPNMPVDA